MLSLMAKEFFATSPLMIFPVAALLIFLATFTVLAVRAITRPKEQIDEMARMPLEDEAAR